MLKIDPWLLRGLLLDGTFDVADVGPLIEAIQAEGGEVSLHFERVRDVRPEAAEELKRPLDEMWESGEVRPLMVWFHVLPEKRGAMADTLVRAGFDMEREGPYEVIYMGPPRAPRG